MKEINGKAIYSPKGKAGEYAEYACNFYVGCSNNCSYCYCKKGILAGVMGQDKPQLKKCFRDEGHALEVFEKELKANLSELQKHGLFFSFTTDPMLPQTKVLTFDAVKICLENEVPVKILTKGANLWIDCYIRANMFFDKKHLVAFGFTLTGHDELEPGASTNQERIEAMKRLHDAGFKTFASIEPIINLLDSFDMIEQTSQFCDLYKIGLMSGQKVDDLLRAQLKTTIQFINLSARDNGFKVYYKNTLLKAAGIDRCELPKNCVTRDYNLFQP